MTPFDLVDNLKLPRKRGSVPREKLMNSEAWGTGLFGVASSAVAVLLKHYLSERKSKRQAKRLED